MKKKILVKKKKSSIGKIRLVLSIDMLNIILAYCISEDESITRGNITNVRKLWDMIDDDVFDRDYESQARFKFIKRVLKHKLDGYIENPTILLNAARSSKYEDVEDEIIADAKNIKLRLSEIKFITKFVSDKLTYSFLYSHKDIIMNMFMKLESGEFETFSEIKDVLKRNLSSLLGDIRRAEMLQDQNDVFSLVEDLFNSSVTKTVKKIQSPTRSLYTGVQYLNEMLGGNGFESGRLYMFLGLSGGFKSGTLLNMGYQLKMFNFNYKAKDEVKRPTVLYVTQENSVLETIDRLFSLACGRDTKDRMKNYTPEEAINKFRKEGKMVLTLENNIDIMFMYKAPGTIDTQDLYSIIDEVEEDGAEVICLIHDYIKKLRSVRPNRELRIELGNISDELKALAIEKDIPVISASQLNRESARTIDAAVESNQADLARMLGSSNVGESWNMIENSDLVVIVNRERLVSENRLYLTFKRVKLRNGPDDTIDYFNHPFKQNEFALETDLYLDKPLSRKYLSETLIGVEEDDVIQFDKKGRTNSKNRKNLGESYNLNDIDIIFNHNK